MREESLELTAMGAARKVVLVSESGYSPGHDELLLELVRRPVRLFCAVGKDCEKFEDAVDWMCVDEYAASDFTVITTSHPNETEAEVLEFASQFFDELGGDVEVIRV